MRLYLIFPALFFLLLTGCAQRLMPETPLSDFKPEPPREKKDFYLSVIGSDPSNGTLTLIDDNGETADTLAVHGKDKIYWLISDSNVIAITGILGKSDEDQEKFRDKPQHVPGSKAWAAKMKNFNRKKQSSYKIEWKDKSGNPRTFDPLIQLYPR